MHSTVTNPSATDNVIADFAFIFIYLVIYFIYLLTFYEYEKVVLLKH